MTLNKKLLLGLGASVAIAAPIAVVASCSTSSSVKTVEVKQKATPGSLTETQVTEAVDAAATKDQKWTVVEALFEGLTKDDMDNVTLTSAAGTEDSTKKTVTITTKDKNVLVLNGTTTSVEFAPTATTPTNTYINIAEGADKTTGSAAAIQAEVRKLAVDGTKVEGLKAFGFTFPTEMTTLPQGVTIAVTIDGTATADLVNAAVADTNAVVVTLTSTSPNTYFGTDGTNTTLNISWTADAA